MKEQVECPECGGSGYDPLDGGQCEQTGKSMSYEDCSADLTVFKKSLPWLSEADSVALQSSLKDLDRKRCACP